jgi:putative phosphoribosyl transferase
VVDDGIATGDTLKAALTAIQGQQPARIIIAAPVAPPDEVGNLQGRGYEVVCPLQPKDMVAVGYWYKDFRPVSDEEVLEILRHQTPMYRA